jgi:hypothetical protein
MGGKIPFIMAGWKWLIFEGAIPHMVPDELLDVIVKDLESRGCPLSEKREGMYLYLDQPGMMCTTRPNEELELRELDLEVPSEDFSAFLGDLSELKLREGGYYKLHGFHRCIVLTPALKKELLRLMAERFPTAEARAMEFYAGRKLPSEVLRDIAAKQTGKPVEEIPNLGGNKLDRFKAKDDGSLPN